LREDIRSEIACTTPWDRNDVQTTLEKDAYHVSIPDFDIATQGTSIVNAIEMACDAIGLMGIGMAYFTFHG